MSTGTKTSSNPCVRLLATLAIPFTIALVTAPNLPATPAAPAATFERPRVPLLGEWDFAFVPPDGDPARRPAATDWQTVTITERSWATFWKYYKIDWRGADRDRIEHVWYRRTITLPSSTFRGKRAHLHFDAVAFTSKIFVNGQPVGQNADGFLPFDIDITDALRPDAPNEIALLVGNAQEAYRQGQPIGAMHKFTGGIAGNCYIEARPPLHITDIFVKPSTRRGLLAVEATLSRPAATAPLWRIYKDDTIIKEGVAPLPPGSRSDEKNLRWEIPWPDAEHWSPENPRLHRFVLALPATTTTPADRHAITFGFREVWLDGPALYLNGKKIRLYSRWGHTGEFYYATNAKGRALPPDELWKTAKTLGLNSVRLHGQPYPKVFLEAADRQGFLIIDESALFHRPGTPQALDHLRRLVHRDRNHPSVILWSGSNEYEHWKIPRNPAATTFLVRATAEIKRHDPSRPVYHSAYGETDGHDDAINVHYPDGGSAQNWPHVLRWPDNPALSPTANVAGHLKPWNRARPLMAGEHQLTPASVAPLIGPDYFRMTPAAIRAAHGRWYSELAILYREQDLLLFGQPILTINNRRRIDTERDTEIARRGFAPLAFTLYPWTDNWFADETARYELLLSNDRLTDFRGVFTLTLRDPSTGPGGKELLRQTLPATAAQGRSTRIPVALDLATLNLDPAKNAITTLTLVMELNDAPGSQPSPLPPPSPPPLERTLRVFRRPARPADNTDAPAAGRRRHLHLYSTSKDKNKNLARFVPRATAPLSAPDEIATLEPTASVLLLPSGLTAAEQQKLGAPLERFVHAGGRVLVLAQNNYATGWLPFNARLSSAPATVLYPASTAHPVTRGLPDGALRFWRPDHTVVRVAVEPGDGVAARLLADYPVPALAEILHGGGIYLLSQIELEPALGIEPMAEKLLSRMTGYLCNQVADTENATTLIASTGSRFSRALAERGARLEATRPNLDPAFLTSPSPPAAVPPSGPPVAGPSATGTRQLLWDATTVPLERDAWLRLDPWIKSGGRLVLHGLDADAIRRLAEWTSLPLSPVTPATAATPAAGPVTLLDDPLNRGIGMASLAFGDKGQPHPRQYPALTTTTLTATPVPIPGLRPATAPAMVWGTLAWGAGQIVFDQSRWEDETLKIAEAGRFASALLTNLGLRFASLPITAEPGGWHPLDLRPAFNAVIETEYNKNYPDRQNVDAGLLLRGDWPRGRQTLQGVLFDIADPRTVPAGRNLIRINTANTTAGGVRIESFPGGARSVRVTVPAVNAARLAFLHTALHLWGDRFGQFSAAAGSRMWDYEIDYESGRRVRIPVLADRHSGRLRDGGIADKPEARLSFSSTDETGEQTAYYEMQWRNPTPEDKITGITIIGGNNPAKMPVVLAISYQAWEHTFQ